MVVPESGINNIMGGLESAEGVRLHNHRRKLRQRFDIVRKLGQGTYGKVQLGINKETGQEVAIKIIKKCKIKTEADLIRIRREIQIMSSVRHPNIIHIYEVFENQDKMVLVMEYAAGGELYEYLNERNVLTEEEARRIFRQISTAIYYCHKHKICHRDLKLENILLDEHGSAKIADFGLSNVFSESRLLTTFCGSPLYASPEIVKGIPYHGPEVDCWSLGVLLYILVYKAMPFDGSNFKRLVRQISQGDYFEPKNPSPASPLIRSMLNVNPAHRADIISICSHWWMDQTYPESCLETAKDLANLTPVRLDLLLSLVPSVSSEQIVIGDIQVDPQSCEKPVRSQSLDSIAPLRVNSALNPINVPPIDSSIGPAVDKNATRGEKKKVKTKSKRERSSSRTRKKESSTSIDSDADGMKPKKKSVKKEDKKVREREETQPEILENDAENIEKLKENIRLINNSLKNNEVNEVGEDPEKYSLDGKEISADTENSPEKKEAKQEPLLEKSDNDQNVDKSKLSERRRSKVFETAEKFSSLNNSQASKPVKKIFLPGVKVGDAKREYERKSSLVESSSNLARASSSRRSLSGKSKSPSPAASPEKKYSLASTINLNKLAESALKKSSEEVTPSSSAEVSRTSSVSAANEVASTTPSSRKVPERVKEKTPEAPSKTSPEKVVSKKPLEKISKDSSESSLSKSSSVTTAPATDSDPTHQAKLKNAVKVISHAISVDGENKAATIPRRKTSRAEIVLAPPTRSVPVKAPEYKSEVEHFINEPLAPLKSQVTIPIAAPTLPKPVSRPAAPTKQHFIPIQFEEEVSKTPTPPSSLHSLSKQSTFDSDSQISVSSSGEPIRKSAREVIIPIAVEGGGFVTPASDNMSRISSFDETEEERPRCFTLHSSRRRHPHSDRIESTDSISSDEDDDNFEILTAENLFSTLLNRVRSLTHKLSTEDGAQHSFPRSFFTQHHSIFDNLPSRRLAGTRSFARSDSAPWRRRPISSIPSDFPETYSARRLSKETEGPAKFDDKPPPYQARSSYSASRPSYLRSLSNSLSSSNAYTNQYPWKYKIDEQETNIVNNEDRDNFRKGIHRHSFHGTGLDYSKYNGNFNPETLKLDDLNLPMIPEVGSASAKSESAAHKYSPSRWSNKTSDASSSHSDSRRNSESRDDDNTPVASPDPSSRQSPNSYASESSRVSRIPTFQRSNSVTRETGNRRLYQRSYSVTPERSISSSRLLSNGPTSRASTPEPSLYSQRYSRFLPPSSTRQTPDRKLSADYSPSVRQTPDRKLSEDYSSSVRRTPDRKLSEDYPPSIRRTPDRKLSEDYPPSVRRTPDKKLSEDLPPIEKTTRYRRYGVSSSASPLLPPTSRRLSSRGLTYSSSSSSCINPDKEDKTCVKSNSSRLSSLSLATSNSSSNCTNPDKDNKSCAKSNSSRPSSRGLAYSNSFSNCTNPDKDDKSSVKSSSSRLTSRGLVYSNSSSNCTNPNKEDKSCVKSSLNRRTSRGLVYSNSSSNCANPDKDDKSCVKSSLNRQTSRGLVYSNSSSNCANPDKDDKASIKSSLSRRSSRSLLYSSSSNGCVNPDKEDKSSIKSSSDRLSSRALAYSSSSSNCANPEKEDKASVQSNSSRRSLTYSNSSNNCANSEKEDKASVKSNSSRLFLSRRNLTYSNSSSNCTNQGENKSLTMSDSCAPKSRGLSYSNSSSNCASPDKGNKSLVKSSSMNKVSSVNQNRLKLDQISPDAVANANGKSNNELQKPRKIGPYSRSLTAAVSGPSKSDVIKRRSSFTSDNRNSVKATIGKTPQSSDLLSSNIKPLESNSSLSRNAVREEGSTQKVVLELEDKSNSNQPLNDLKTGTIAVNNTNLYDDSSLKQCRVDSIDLKTVGTHSSSSTFANVSDMSESRSRTSSVRGEYSQPSEVTEGSITNQSSFSDFDESYLSSRRNSSTSTLNELTEMRAKSNCSRINDVVTSSKDDFVSRPEDLVNRRDELINRNDSVNSSRREAQQFVSPKPSKTTFKPQTVSNNLKSKFEVSSVADNGLDIDHNFVAKLAKKTGTHTDKRDIKDIIGEASHSSGKLRPFSEVFPGKSFDSGADEDSSAKKRTHPFLESKINKNGKPVLNYEFHRRLTSPSYQEETGGNWIQDSSTSRFLNSYLRRSPSVSRQTVEKNQENGISTTPVRSPSGILVKRSASSCSMKKDSAGPSKLSSKDLKLGIPNVMYNSEISSYDETSSIVSPTEDGSDTWSASSDYTDAFEYLPPSGRSLSCPTGEDSVSDRIRRKSYYSRFNPAITSRRFLSSTLNFTNTLRPGSRLPSYSRSFSTDMTRSLNKF